MKESLVQWTLLKNLDFLSGVLDFEVAEKKGQEITTDFGRIDFVVENRDATQLIVELETNLSRREKLNYCFDQVLNYKNVSFSERTAYCILYSDDTNTHSRSLVRAFGEENNVLVKTYSLNEVKHLYTATVERLSLSFGLALPKPANYTICFLRWLSKILKPFKDYNSQRLDAKKTGKYFTSPRTTNFRCYLKLAQDFEMIVQVGNQNELTANGLDYIRNFSPEIEFAANLSSVDLTNEQRRILLRVITNGNWTAHKVNIYWFLRFLEVTNGEWVPNIRNFDSNKLELVNGLFNVKYKSRTMYEFLSFACNWCLELGLVDIIKTGSNYDRVFLTPLGIEISNIFSLDLQMKKSRLNLNFKYLD